MIIRSTLDQPYQLCAAIYAGMLVGAIFSIGAALFTAVKSKVCKIIISLLFSLLSAAVFAACLYLICSFNLRFYHILGGVCGFFIFVAAVLPVFRFIRHKIREIAIELKHKTMYNKNNTSGKENGNGKKKRKKQSSFFS